MVLGFNHIVDEIVIHLLFDLVSPSKCIISGYVTRAVFRSGTVQPFCLQEHTTFVFSRF